MTNKGWMETKASRKRQVFLVRFFENFAFLFRVYICVYLSIFSFKFLCYLYSGCVETPQSFATLCSYWSGNIMKTNDEKTLNNVNWIRMTLCAAKSLESEYNSAQAFLCQFFLQQQQERWKKFNFVKSFEPDERCWKKFLDRAQETRCHRE